MFQDLRKMMKQENIPRLQSPKKQNQDYLRIKFTTKSKQKFASKTNIWAEVGTFESPKKQNQDKDS